ncbi:hypothetical protein AN958_04698 [Leucoagaricus sp. SymC.cos]|nr:hypothetical protein AN958_04698 [Leucoagaricus sp. SymC.cos]
MMSTSTHFKYCFTSAAFSSHSPELFRSSSLLFFLRKSSLSSLFTLRPSFPRHASFLLNRNVSSRRSLRKPSASLLTIPLSLLSSKVKKPATLTFPLMPFCLTMHQLPSAGESECSLYFRSFTFLYSSLLGLSTLGFDALRIHRIRRRLEFLAEDDRLLLQDKPKLSEKELTEALEERGLLDRQMTLQSKETKLKWWLNSIQSSDPSNAIARRLALMVRHSAGSRPLYT